MKVILVANSKGGVGKTMFASHLAWAADEQGLSVIAIDSDTQGALFRRLTDDQPSETDQVADFGENSTVCWSREINLDVDGDCDLAIIDTKGKDEIVELIANVQLDLVVIPINGKDALIEANSIISDIREDVSKDVDIVLVLNQLSIGGSAAKKLRSLHKKKLPPHMSVMDIEVGTSRCVWTSEEIAQSAWSQPHVDRQATELKYICWELLEMVGLVEVKEVDDVE